MKQHIQWWKRVCTEFIKNKTRREISETTWRSCLEWMLVEIGKCTMNDIGDDALLNLEAVVRAELEGK